MAFDSTVFPASMQVGNFADWCLMESYLKHKYIYVCIWNLKFAYTVEEEKMLPGELSVDFSFFFSHAHYN